MSDVFVTDPAAERCVFIACDAPADADYLPCERHRLWGRLLFSGWPADAATDAADGHPVPVELTWAELTADADGTPAGVTRHTATATATATIMDPRSR